MRIFERILVNGDIVRAGDLVIRIELGSSPTASSETQLIGPETIDQAGSKADETAELPRETLGQAEAPG
jgi:hypothetical protein